MDKRRCASALCRRFSVPIFHSLNLFGDVSFMCEHSLAHRSVLMDVILSVRYRLNLRDMDAQSPSCFMILRAYAMFIRFTRA